MNREMHFVEGYITVQWTPPHDGYSPILTYDLELGEYNTPAQSILWRKAVLNTIPGTINTTNVGFSYGSVYYFRVSAVNLVGEGEAGEVSSILNADVPSAPTSIYFLNDPMPSGSTNDTQIGIKWVPVVAPPGDAFTYNVQIAASGK
jgi:Fibronectin type III domain